MKKTIILLAIAALLVASLVGGWKWAHGGSRQAGWTWDDGASIYVWVDPTPSGNPADNTPQ